MINNNIRYLEKEVEKIKTLYLNKKFEQVIKKTQTLLKKNPNQPMFYNLIGLSYLELDNFDMALNILLLGKNKFPKEPSILCNIGIAYKAKWDFPEAKENFLMALKNNPKHVQSYVNLGHLETALNNNEAALNYYLEAYKINNNIEGVLTYLVLGYSANGDFVNAKKIIKEINTKFPNNSKSFQLYSKIHTYEKEDDHQKIMLDRIKDQNLDNENLANFYFALAKSFFDQKNIEKSAEFTLKANETKFKTFSDYNFNLEIQKFERMKFYFKDYNFDKPLSDYGENLIFILGLPRSGTTLMHQIIGSHSKVIGVEESDFLNQSLEKMFKEENDFKNFFKNTVYNKNEILKISEDILSKYKMYHENKIIVDKNPFNFRWIGFIKILFPNAKIIHSNRNIIDSAFSIYRNIFDSPLGWTYHQDYLVQYIKHYKILMNFWNEKLRNFIYDYKYEYLVNNQIEETKNILNFCKLDFEENCIDYTKNKISVRTVSVAQARQKIYKSSVKFSENYIDYFSFLKSL